MRSLAAFAIACSFATFTYGEDFAAVADSMARVRFRRQDDALLLDISETARALGWEVKIVTPGKLVTVCRQGHAGVCVPLRLDKIRWRQEQEQLFVEAATLERVLRFWVETANNVVTLRRIEHPADPADSEIPAYNTEWGPGRGFRVGQTLPDIPLYDMQGHEVRLSRFLGKQLAIYVWASW